MDRLFLELWSSQSPLSPAPVRRAESRLALSEGVAGIMRDEMHSGTLDVVGKNLQKLPSCSVVSR